MMLPYLLLISLVFTAHVAAETLRFGTFKSYMYLGRKRECWLDHGQEECRWNRAFEGYCAALMELLAGMMHVDYRIDTRKPWAGSLREDGTWDGILGDVNSSVVDLAIAPIAVTQERAAFVDFSPPFLTSGISLMMKKSETAVPWMKHHNSLNPFAPTTWTLIILLQILASFIFLINNILCFESITSLIGLYVRMRKADVDKGRQERLWICLFSLLVWIGCSFMLIASILHHLGAVSALNELVSLNPVEELVKQGNVKFLMQEKGEAHQFFKASNSSLHKQMLKSIERNGGSSFLNIYESGVESDGIKKVRASNGSVAFIVDDLSNIYENSRLPCDTVKIGENLATFQYAVATKKGSDLSGKVHAAMESLLASGELEKLNREWFIERSQCQEDRSVDRMMTNAEQIANYVMFVMIIGIGLSTILSLIVSSFRKKSLHSKLTDELDPIHS